MRSASNKSRIALILVTVLLAVFMLSAANADSGLEITVWYSHNGNGESTMAVSLSDTGTDYWAQLPYDAFDGEIGISLNDLYGRYAGWSADFGTVDGNNMTISGVSSAGGSVDGFPTLTIYALDPYGNQVAVYSLYLSVSPAPMEPVGPTSADIQVYYQSEDGSYLGSTTATIASNSGDFIYAQEFSGYQLVSEGSVYVTVDGNGNPSQYSVTFTYRALPQNADITVYYQTEDGMSLGGTTVTIASNNGDYICAQDINGYQLISEGSVYVTVDGNGNPSQNPVIFTYRVLPQSADITVYYQTEDGSSLGGTTATIASNNGDYIYAQEINGYQLVSEASVYVTVDGNGNPSQNPVIFTYRALPQSADITVYYQSEDGSSLGGTTVTIASNNGDYIYAQEINGYQLISEGSVYVTVDGNGNPSQNPVIFTYRALPQSADITVYYQTEDGSSLGGTTVTIASNNGDTIYAQVINGYQLVSEGSVYVTVDGNGNPSQNPVIFTYCALPQSADITVYYQTEDGSSLGGTTVTIASNNGDTIYAQEINGYQLVSEGSVYVTVDGNGNPSQNPVIFTYRALPQSADITVYYQTEDGSSLGGTTVTIASNSGSDIYAQDISGYQVIGDSSAYVTVDAYGNSSQNPVIFTYRVLPQSADITVYYQTEDGSSLSGTTVTIASNSGSDIYAQEISGYQIVGESNIYVTVDAYGNPSQNPVVFTYRALPQSVDITVYYQTEDGASLGGTTLTIASNSGSDIYAQEISGYQVVGDSSAYVTVDDYGNPSQNPVVFTYRELPQSADITVYYQAEDGSSLGGTTVTIASNSGSDIYAQDISGYQVVGESSVYVTVDAYGNPSQNPVIFTYHALPQSAEITIYYQAEDGSSLGGTIVTIASGSGDTIYAQEISGYQLIGESSVIVTVDAYGNPSVNPVIFNYRALPESAEVLILYTLPDGTEINRTTLAIARGESRTITPDLLNGYQLVAGTETQFTVTVDALGNIDKTQITFIIERIPQDGTVAVFHKTQDGNVLEQETVTVPAEGSLNVNAKNYDGYTLEEGQSSEVAVVCDRDGNVKPAEVTFIYRALPGSVEVQIRYTLADGTEISRNAQAIARGESKTITPDLPAGYQLVVGTENQFTVTVDALGNIDTTEVIFIIERIPQDGTLIVIHKTQDRNVLEQESITVPSESSLNVNAKNYDGYTLEEGQPAEIMVSCDRDGNVNPIEVTFIYRALPGSVEVQILYTLADGTEVNRSSQVITRGESKIITPAIPDGYQLVSGTETQFTVTVDALGNIDTPQVIFMIERIPQDGILIVFHKTQDGNVLEQENNTVQSETSIIVHTKNYDGYTLEEGQPAEITVTCDRVGNVNPSEVTFIYRALPGSVAIPVVYATVDGMELSRTEVQISRGDSRRFDAEPPAGYRLTDASPNSVTVTVNDLGVADTSEVRFIVELIPQNGTVTVYYCDVGGNFLTSQVVQVSGGQTVQIAPDPSAVPSGFDPASASAQTVRVAADGTANPNQIYFNLARLDNPSETAVPNKAETLVQRWAKTKENNVKLRRGVGRNTTELASIRNKDSEVWVIDMVQGSDGWVWDHVIYNGQEGYIRSDKLTILKQAASDDRQQTVTTPMPTVTPTPTAPVITPTPTPSPVVITPTPTPANYYGYAISRVSQSLLSATSSSARGLQTINQSDLLTVGGQVTNEGTTWSYVITETGASGYVPDNTLQRISDEEAAQIRQQNITPEPATPTPTTVPIHTGLFKPVGDNVPLRAQPDDISVLLRLLNRETNGRMTVVYVTGQIYDTEDGWIWHTVEYDGVSGFIRSDMLVELSSSEKQDYLSGTTPTPEVVAPTATPAGIDYTTMSSYGYIKSANDKSVNIRNNPNGSKIAELQPYATCLVLGTQTVNGTVWYHIKFDNGTKNIDGWVKGDSATEAGFFHQMTMEEFQQFVQSPQYQEGIRRNSTSGTTANPNATSGIATIEEQNVQEWTDPNSNTNVNYATWAPIPTTKPIEYTTPNNQYNNVTDQPAPTDSNALPTTSTLPISTESGTGIANIDTPDASSSPSASNTANGSITSATENNDNPPNVPWALIIGGGLAVIGGGVGVGVYLHSQNKRNAAKRAAQRRAQASSGAARQNPQPANYNTSRTVGQPSNTIPSNGNMNGGVAGRPVNPSPSNPYQPKFSSTTAQTPQNGNIYSTPVQSTTPQQASTSAYQRPVTAVNPAGTVTNATGTNPVQNGGIVSSAGAATPPNVMTPAGTTQSVLHKPAVSTPTTNPASANQPTATPYRSNEPSVLSKNPEPAQQPTETIRNRRAGQTNNDDSPYKPMT